MKCSTFAAIQKQNAVTVEYVANDEGGRRYFAVLELPPVESPQTAVKAVIRSEIQNAEKRGKGR